LPKALFKNAIFEPQVIHILCEGDLFSDYAVIGIYVVLLRFLLCPLRRRGAHRAGWKIELPGFSPIKRNG